MKEAIKFLFRYLYPVDSEVNYYYLKGFIYIDYSGVGECKLYRIKVDELQIRFWLRHAHLLVEEKLSKETIQSYAENHRNKWERFI